MDGPPTTPDADAIRDRFVDSIAANKAFAAERLLIDAVAAGLSARDAYMGVLQPALYEVGRRWELGELTVAQEHLATAVVQSLLARIAGDLAPDADGARVVRGRVIVACTPGELHSVGARFIGDFLEGDGWEVLALGPSTPAASLVEMVVATRPAAVALSTTLSENLDSARDVFDRLEEVEPRPLVLAGGRAYRGEGTVARALGADAFAADAEALRDLLRESLART